MEITKKNEKNIFKVRIYGDDAPWDCDIVSGVSAAMEGMVPKSVFNSPYSLTDMYDTVPIKKSTVTAISIDRLSIAEVMLAAAIRLVEKVAIFIYF